MEIDKNSIYQEFAAESWKRMKAAFDGFDTAVVIGVSD